MYLIQTEPCFRIFRSTRIEHIVIYRNAQWSGVTETGEIVNYPNGE